MVLTVVAFFAAFLLIASGGLLLFYSEALPQRIAEAINPRPKRNVINAIRETGFSIGGAMEHFEHLLPKSQAEIGIVLQRLQRAGFRDEAAMKIFYGCKVAVPLMLCVLAFVTRLATLAPFFV
jgi:tight adherence protein C